MRVCVWRTCVERQQARSRRDQRFSGAAARSEALALMPRILLADDQEEFRGVIREALEDEGYAFSWNE